MRKLRKEGWGDMWLYEGIIRILDEKGPLPISSLYNEASKLFVNAGIEPNQSDIYSAVNKKQELFWINKGLISIQPSKQPVYLSVYAEMPGIGAYQLRVDFIKGYFTAIEWRDIDNPRFPSNTEPKTPGDMAFFKTRVYRSAIWNWDKHYLPGEGIVLDGFNWTVNMKTVTGIYTCSGTNKYPAKWNILCRGIRELTGYPFG
ncbi:hypothetical protein [Bacillus sp. FJAT-27445]|uniref:hypothetical protein n=1 Tax=Bacillus sp. FJAT-27445 TaxID=1679166 RepID=UPI00074435A3|nr:hypothetical protein [Bacillus sp. FJAT-27445]